MASNPVRTAGVVAAALAAWVVLATVGVVSLAGVTTDGVTTARVLEVAVARPAYLVALVVGLLTSLLTR
jgi:hypothetical protein